MKKLFFYLFASMLLCSCSCILGQIPPQYIYAGSGCTAPMPDYKSKVTVIGGCSGYNLTQTPTAGTIITVLNSPQMVIIKASGLNGKSSQTGFTVTMLDTITPIITTLQTFVDDALQRSKVLYDAADRINGKLLLKDSLDNSFTTKLLVYVSGDSAGIRKSFSMYVDSLCIPLYKQDTTKLTNK